MSKHDRIAFESAEYLDSRDLEERYDYLAGDDERDEDEEAEMQAIADLRDQYHDAEEWRTGVTLIPEESFEDYAEELAEETGAISREATWPQSFIDWTAAAYALRQDYAELEVTVWGLRTTWLAR